MARTTVIHPPPETREQIIARLDQWRERLTETKTGTVNTVLTLPEIRDAIDVLLDDLLWMIRVQP